MKNMHNAVSISKPVDKEYSRQKISPFGRLFRFIGWWFGFSGFYSVFAVCPFCGQQGCPVGMASAGAVGAFFALCIQDWKLFFLFLKRKMFKHCPKNTAN